MSTDFISPIQPILTGTPIENRLSELWSIFDYLMPGFLYGYETFRKELESPIAKNRDEEAAKKQVCVDLIKSAIEGEHRMLIFSQFTSMLALLEEDLRKEGITYYKITGSTSKEERIRLVKNFNEGDVPVFLISLKAGGTGLNLVGADMVIHYDPWWNQAVQNQATDRAHRIGQKKIVTVYKLIAKGTIEEKIVKLQESKKNLADEILSGEHGGLAQLSKEELGELLWQLL